MLPNECIGENMSTSQGTIDYIIEQMSGAGKITAKKMFGEYGVYCDEKIVALVCDDELFVKPTKAGRAFIGECEERPPYKGAKPYLYISGDQWDDDEWLSKLIKLSAAELPLPKKKS
jgi:TfoX/Sxy family transcriptional regulator of competence genes